jgi:predicted amidophosphoribosyltransferase
MLDSSIICLYFYQKSDKQSFRLKSKKRRLIMPEYICPHCKISLRKITNHCGNCGGKLPADLKPFVPLCPVCKEEIDMATRLGGPKYCENCGEELNPSEV